VEQKEFGVFVLIAVKVPSRRVNLQFRCENALGNEFVVNNPFDCFTIASSFSHSVSPP